MLRALLDTHLYSLLEKRVDLGVSCSLNFVFWMWLFSVLIKCASTQLENLKNENKI